MTALIAMSGMLVIPNASVQAAPVQARVGDYVALGDSFAAGPAILPLKDLDVVAPCTRSAVNYPSLLAKTVGAERFTDATCGGAETEDIDLVNQGTGLLGAPIVPQVRHLSRRTDLVTLTIGGNDAGLVQAALKCAYRLSDEEPCMTGTLKRETEAKVDAVGPALRRVLGAIRTRAPHARVLVTSYTNYADVSHSKCSNQHVRGDDIAALQSIVDKLGAVQREVAEDLGVEYVDLISPAVGHDGCSAAPWSNAAQPILNLHDFSVAFHPTAAGERAFARIIADRVTEGASAGSPA
ncbi:SGNH/GDSL hydrolase family protein [Gordonia sp. HY442]|uniref:SGNH/GDSL hydrolase family protein n=1 Tax=Gordonia zhenghanii TaxID=2911516 RepID=UPI001F32B86D|nr:SGNH/GDSL hydrolase family protein [Gordonia zhenghanii]MCF8604302.1 SGNH/GDSL hydrolase family protein [Gordonia zhenghanii]